MRPPPSDSDVDDLAGGSDDDEGNAGEEALTHDNPSSSESGAETDEDIHDLVTQETYGVQDLALQRFYEKRPRAMVVLRSRGVYGNRYMNVNIAAGSHFSYIKSVKGYAKSWKCRSCDRLFRCLSDQRKTRAALR